MPISSGKLFEFDIMNSIPEELFKYKLRDSAAAWSGGTNTRFSVNNICDLILLDHSGWLHLWELKSHKGASFPISPKTNEKGKITHYGIIKVNQLEGLLKECNKKHIVAGFVFNLADKEKTYFVEVTFVNTAITEGLKSLNVDWLEKHGRLIPQKLKGRSKKHYEYNLTDFLL